MFRRICILAAILCQIESALGAPQLRTSSGPGKTLKQSLLDRGVKLDSESLLKALDNPDQITQSLAASELAVEHVDGASDRIVAAYRRAELPVARFNLAQAMFRLDPNKGTPMLREVCQPHNSSVHTELQAIGVLQDAGDYTCQPELLKILRTGDDPSWLLEGIGLLNAIPAALISSVDRRSIEAELINNVNTVVRVAAAESLIRSHDAESIRIVRRRLSVETDPEVLRVLNTAQDQ